jgi:predicted transcriptional regulator
MDSGKMGEEDKKDIDSGNLLEMTAQIVASYVGHNSLVATEIPDLIKSVHGSLAAAEGGSEGSGHPIQKPAVPIRKSVTPDFVICLEDGKKLKMLKRHLRTTYGMSPEQYRTKWGLPIDYPMVAPNYAKQRSAFAKKIGLGRKPAAAKTRRRRKK